MGPKRPKAVESLKALCFDRPMALLGDVLDPGGVVDFQSGKYRQDFREMKTFDHGQVLVHSYEKQGRFKNHRDVPSREGDGGDARAAAEEGRLTLGAGALRARPADPWGHP